MGRLSGVPDFDIHVTPEPSAEDREAVIRAVREVLRREAEHARPSAWRAAGWTAQRTGVRDLPLSDDRRWVLSARLPLGGRVFPGLGGRGDAK
jgi:hypothetical protein